MDSSYCTITEIRQGLGAYCPTPRRPDSTFAVGSSTGSSSFKRARLPPYRLKPPPTPSPLFRFLRFLDGCRLARERRLICLLMPAHFTFFALTADARPQYIRPPRLNGHSVKLALAAPVTGFAATQAPETRCRLWVDRVILNRVTDFRSQPKTLRLVAAQSLSRRRDAV